MLFVSFGCGLDGNPALFGGGGRGGSCVGLPAVDMSIDFRLTSEPPDLLRLCFLASSVAGSIFLGIGRGLCTTEVESSGVRGRGGIFDALSLAPSMILCTSRGSSYTMLLMNMTVC